MSGSHVRLDGDLRYYIVHRPSIVANATGARGAYALYAPLLRFCLHPNTSEPIGDTSGDAMERNCADTLFV